MKQPGNESCHNEDHLKEIKMKSKIALLTLALIASATASATGYPTNNTYSGAAAQGSNSVVSGSTSAVNASGTSSATSQAFNVGMAAKTITVSASHDIDTTKTLTGSGANNWGNGGNYTQTTVVEKQGSVNVTGVTETANMSGVKTTDSGAGASALGAAGGIAKSQASGAGAFDTGSGGSPAGNVAGSANSTTATGVASIGNGSNLQNAGRLSEFSATAGASIKETTINTGTKVFGHFVGTAQPSQGDIKNANTSTYAGSVSTGGFGVPTGWTAGGSGSSIGGTINTGAGSALANSSVSNAVSAVVVNP